MGLHYATKILGKSAAWQDYETAVDKNAFKKESLARFEKIMETLGDTNPQQFNAQNINRRLSNELAYSFSALQACEGKASISQEQYQARETACVGLSHAVSRKFHGTGKDMNLEEEFKILKAMFENMDGNKVTLSTPSASIPAQQLAQRVQSGEISPTV